MTTAMAAAAAAASIDGVRRVVAESPVVVVGRRGCCLGHVVKRLLQGLGVNPTVCELADSAAAAGAGAGCGGTAVDDAAILEEFTGIGGGGGCSPRCLSGGSSSAGSSGSWPCTSLASSSRS
uniref:Uncharacterized protein n=1 Tax=Ananas comosus var. bracteatus TaxID=296719 RepID=A0A6V7PU14_ANACO|nr:unnamed protein product [Ananas comosus var. bracteatus]